MLQYDADGNTERRIPGASNPAPPVDPADYIYSHNGQRIKKSSDDAKLFHYDISGQLIAETDTTGSLIKAYVWLHGQPLAQIAADGAVYYYQNDHLGTPQKITDQDAAVVWSADYLPFGKADVNVGAVDNNLRFAGQYYDQETGLHYNWHRYYDPKLGRYLRADPKGIDGGINLYAYASANPIVFIDKDGLKAYYCVGVYDTYIHATVCVDDYCIGLMPNSFLGAMTYGTGRPERKPFVKAYCKEIKIPDCCDQKKLERCILQKINTAADLSLKGKLPYSAVFHNCFQWAGAVVQTCIAESCEGN
jgi:RHS repeat-associated protein